MNIKPSLNLLAVYLLGAGAFTMTAAGTLPGKPNVLFLVVDDLRPELGCYGKDYIKSPNIDTIAKSGMVFNRAYCQQAVCSPSRTCVMTGVRPDTSKVWDLVTHFRDALPAVVTLGQQFKTNGYFVQGMGKIYHPGLDDPATWSVPWQEPKAPIYALDEDADLVGKNMQPKDEDGSDDKGTLTSSYLLPKPNTANASEVATNAKNPAVSKPKRKKANASGMSNPRGPIYECADVPDSTFVDGKTADLAVSTLEKINKNPQPFFLAIGFHKPHLPWVAPKKYWDMYDPAKIELAPNQFVPVDAPDYAVQPNDGEVRAYKGVPPSGPIPLEIQHKLKQAYFAGVSYTDALIGKVLAELDHLNLRSNTIIILWGDHGWKLGEHMAWGKHSNVENDVNAPLMVSVPGMHNAGTHSDALVEFVDIYPTLCELVAIPLPGHLEGTSFKPVLDDPQRAWKTAAFSQYPRNAGKTGAGALMGYTMRTDRYRFTVWVGRKDHVKIDAMELYDHEIDPQENYNMAKKPENAELVAKLLAQWKKGWQGAKSMVAANTK